MLPQDQLGAFLARDAAGDLVIVDGAGSVRSRAEVQEEMATCVVDSCFKAGIFTTELAGSFVFFELAGIQDF